MQLCLCYAKKANVTSYFLSNHKSLNKKCQKKEGLKLAVM